MWFKIFTTKLLLYCLKGIHCGVKNLFNSMMINSGSFCVRMYMKRFVAFGEIRSAIELWTSLIFCLDKTLRAADLLCQRSSATLRLPSERVPARWHSS